MDSAADIAVYLKDIEQWEGRIPFIYRDGAPEGYATIGLGCKLDDLPTAQSLPFWYTDIEDRPARPATAAEIRWDWLRVQSMAIGNRASYYRAHATLIFLDNPMIDTLAKGRLTAALVGLQHLFPTWDALPLPAREGLVDLAWCLGIGKLGTWIHLRAAVAAGDWKTAAVQSHVVDTNPLRPSARNPWRAAKFLAAGGG